MKRSFVREILEIIGSDTISFAGGLPDEILFPAEDISSITQKILSAPEALQYSFSAGIAPLREKLASYYTSLGLQTDPKNILITTGAQQALDIISRVYFKEGAVVEAPAYLGALNVFNSNECPLYPIELADDGVDIENFEKIFSKIGRAYLMCDFQNPTGKCYSIDKRERLAESAIRNNGIIVEDGAYMELFFEKRLPMLTSFAPLNSLHIGSFSKTLAPGLRLGWIRGKEKLLKPLLALKERTDLHTSTLSQMIADEFFSRGLFDTHLPKIRAVYKYKCDYLAQELGRLIPNFKFKKPDGGMFIYGSFQGGIDAYELARKCLNDGAVFVPGGEFYTDVSINSEARFNFTHPTLDEIKTGIDMISAVYYALIEEM
ncbi:PLP-dependent aminotransferase family protein [Sulfurimonas sp. HSL-1716]|uniref:aminotransferase-like domain-containing protein n=1 Tax=Hydrocurvibacter sulfurireducens TaxID=3131937 RepID=UPI0031F80FEC